MGTESKLLAPQALFAVTVTVPLLTDAFAEILFVEDEPEIVQPLGNAHV
jgi:hypothetical protein